MENGSPFAPNSATIITMGKNVTPYLVDSPILAKHVVVPTPNFSVQTCHPNLSHQTEMALVLPTPVNPVRLHNELLGYETDELKLLVNGFTFGFRLGCVKSPSIHPPHNHKSTYEHPEVIEEYIHTGLSKQRIAGPFPRPPLPLFKTSPLGVVPKSEPNKFRIIHDLFFPAQDSVNSNIPREYSQVHYDSIDTVLSLVRQYGIGSLMAKTDIKDAFRKIPVNPKDYHLLGFTWEG